ncbi:BTB/POZ domain-containing protein FBL11-like isoform X1 [Triticum dicoccoides]|uniref:BTB/POZ domain-containing protein FBL11-like isoform X1 n=1 Tax=Triticum dicoccoides TaxID=85692 RepID=UPI00188F35C9|nr:BTB/POZ domain-containing protein FBL11-like isoform X1 [Triticum dicoccoides]
MSAAGDGEDGAAAAAADTVVLEITDAAASPSSAPPPPPIPVSALAGPLPSPTVLAVRADRSRLIESSSYFRALLGGSFSESGSGYVRISCDLGAAVQVLRYLFEPPGSFAISHHNFLPLLEGALFLAVESLLVDCERWFRTVRSRNPSMVVPLDFIIEAWFFAQKHGVTFVEDVCPGYLAQNFVQVISSRSFVHIPYDLLCSTIESPHLTVDSEKQLCEAILSWISASRQSCEQSVSNSADNQLSLLSKVRVCLLPLGFAAGTKRNCFEFGNNAVCMILNLLKDSLQTLLYTVTDDNLDSYRIRLTEYSKKIVLSGCPQLTTQFLYISALPTDLDAVFKRTIVSDVNDGCLNHYNGLVKKAKTLSFRNVRIVDLSKCPNVHFGAAILWMKWAFPELRTFIASYCLLFQFEDLQYLLLRCPWINEINLSIDTSVILSKYSIISSRSEVRRDVNRNLSSYYMQSGLYGTSVNPVFSNISKLILEGRNDITDMNLLEISMLKSSLCYINIKHCTLLTDDGISTLLLNCRKMHSMILSYTSFGNHSIQTLCSLDPSDGFSYHKDEHAHVMAFRLQELHLEGCEGISCAAMSQLVSNMNIVKSLCLRETSLADGALCNFVGSSLEYLDISETVVSMVSLAPVIRRNSNLSCLKTAGCRNLLFEQGEVQSTSGNKYGRFLQEITSTCYLEDVEMGWAFCPVRVDDLIPSFSKVRRMTVGLGTTLPENILHALPEICPFLESLVLRFQVISDRVVRNLLESSTNLQVLCLHYCLGSLTSFSFQTMAPALRILRLQWVTPWITNDDLTILTQNCNLLELLLSGCKLLDSNSQEIISSGWPNLACLQLEECGQITLDGVDSILDCKALEEVLLRHTGRGIGRTIITDAIRELPLLRKLALDLCDASEGGYDTPNVPEGKMMRSVRMSRCKKSAAAARSCFVEASSSSSNPKPVQHRETIVLEWSSRQLTTAVVEERL